LVVFQETWGKFCKKIFVLYKLIFIINNYTSVVNMFYFIGDSFTYGQGIRPPVPTSSSQVDKKHLHTVFDTYLCDTILAGKYGESVEYTNLGQPGCSNHFILDGFLELLPTIAIEDTIVLGTTVPYRNYVLFDSKKDIDNICYLHMNPRQNDALRKNLWFAPETLEYPFNTPLLSSTFNFYTDYYSQEAAPLYEYKKFILQLKSLQYLLRKLNIRVILWEYTVWAFLESIENWSKGVIKDGHWSPNGNIHMARLIDKALDSDVDFIGIEWVQEHIVEVQAESSYIEF